MWGIARQKGSANVFTRWHRMCTRSIYTHPELTSEIQKSMQVLRCRGVGHKLVHIDEWNSLSRLPEEMVVANVEEEANAWKVMKTVIKNDQKLILQEIHKLRDTLHFKYENSTLLEKAPAASEAPPDATRTVSGGTVVPDGVTFKLISGSNGYQQVVAVRDDFTKTSIVLLDAEDVARWLMPILEQGSSLSLKQEAFLSIVAAKLVKHKDKQYVVFLADTTGEASTVLGVRDIQSGFYWKLEETLENVTDFEILEPRCPQDTVRLLLVRGKAELAVAALGPEGLQSPIQPVNLEVPKDLDHTFYAVDATSPAPSDSVPHKVSAALRLSKSKDQTLFFVSRCTFLRDQATLSLTNRYTHWVFDTRSLEQRHCFTTRHESFFEHRHNELLIFERDQDSFMSVRVLNLKEKHQSPELLWSSSIFHISDVDCLARGCVLYGWTEVGRPSLRILLRDLREVYTVDFSHDGTPIVSSGNKQNRTEDGTRFSNIEFCVPTSTLVPPSPTLKPTVIPRRVSDSKTIPFYGSLHVDVNHQFMADTVGFKLSSMLIPELRYSINFPSIENDSSFPSVSLVSTIQQTLLPVLNSEKETTSASAKYKIFRAYCPSEDGMSRIPLTLVRGVYGAAEPICSPDQKRSGSVSFLDHSTQLDPVAQCKTNNKMTLTEVLGIEWKDSSRVHLASAGLRPERWEDTETSIDAIPNCLVVAYSSCGTDPFLGFQEAFIPLLQRGWVIAVAHCRGGSPHSVPSEWTGNAKCSDSEEDWLCNSNWPSLATSPYHWRSIHDLRDVCAFLIAEEFGEKGKLALRVGSAGAILAGSLLNSIHRDLFGCIVLDSPFLDLVTSLTTSSMVLSPSEYTEWGDPTNSLMTLNDAGLEHFRDNSAAGTRFITEQNDKNVQSIPSTNPTTSRWRDSLHLLSLCPYTNVPDASHYEGSRPALPWVLVSASTDDERVPYWQSVKWMCRRRIRGETGSSRVGINTKISKMMFRLLPSGQGGHGGSCKTFDHIDDQHEAEVVALLNFACQ